MDERHGGIDAFAALVGSEQPEIGLRRNLNVHAQPVGIPARLHHQLPARTRYALHVDISPETVYGTELLHHAQHPLHRIIGTAHHTGTEEKPLDIVTAVELHGQSDQLRRRKHRTRPVVATPVDTVGTVVYAVVGQHYLEQRHATAILRETVAHAPRPRTARRPVRPPPANSARRTRHIVFRRFGQYPEFFRQIRLHLRLSVLSSAANHSVHAAPPQKYIIFQYKIQLFYININILITY